MDVLAVIGIALAIIGIAATILLSTPVIEALLRVYNQIKRRRWSAKQHVKGLIFKLRHFAFEEWEVKIKVDDVGTTYQEFNARVINLTPNLITTFYLPLYSDGSNIPAEIIQPWAKSYRTILPVKFDFWDPKNARGRIAITYVPPLKPGERRRIKWGLTLPDVFKDGDEYYNWDVEVPYYDMVGTLTFSDVWQILYVRWGSNQYQAPPSLEGNRIKWKVKFPEPGVRIVLKLGLTHRRRSGSTPARGD